MPTACTNASTSWSRRSRRTSPGSRPHSTPRRTRTAPSATRSWHCTRTVWPCCGRSRAMRSEEHTSELQSRGQLVCRLLLEKKKIQQQTILQYNILKHPQCMIKECADVHGENLVYT